MKRAQRGDRAAFGLLAAEIATRFLAISRRILRDIDLAEDATQQALVAIWRDLPRLRDPARFDAWSYRLLVRACYAEGRRARQWSPNLRILPADEPSESGGLDAVIHRDQLERPSDACRWTTGPCWSCTTTPTSRSTGWPRSWRSRSARSTLDSITRCAPCGRHSMPTSARRKRRRPDDHRTRSPHAHRPVVASRGRPRGRRARAPARPRRGRRDTTAPALVAGAEVRRHELLRQAGDRRCGRGRDRGRRLPVPAG